MYEFKYEIRLNDEGRPYIHLSEDYKTSIEDNFMALEIARYVVYELIEKQTIKPTLPEGFIKELALTGDVLAGLGNNIAKIIKGQNESVNELLGQLDVPYEYFVEVDTIEERNAIPFEGEGFLYFDGLTHVRREGLKVKVLFDNTKYILSGGITNEHWTEIK